MRIHVFSNTLFTSIVVWFVEMVSSYQWIIIACLSCSLNWCLRLSIHWFRLFFFISPTLFILLVGGSITFNIPWVIHHKSKVFIIINWATYIVIILNEFSKCNSSVLWIRMLKRIKSYKSSLHLERSAIQKYLRIIIKYHLQTSFLTLHLDD